MAKSSAELREYNRLKMAAWRAKNPDRNKSQAAAWRLANPEKAKAREQRYRDSHREVLSARHRAYQLAKPEICRAKAMRWAVANPEKVRAANRLYRSANPEAIRENHQRHYLANRHVYIAAARQREIDIQSATPQWADMKEIAAIYAEAKRRGNDEMVEYHVDHVVPLRGKNVCGLHVQTNLEIKLASLNLSKGNSF